MIFHWVIFVSGFIVAVAGGVSKTLDTLQWGWDNTVLANSIAQAAIEVTGDGVVATKQRPGVGHRVFDAVWPF